MAGVWSVEMFLAAFAGGAFGASIGALPAFTFTGFLVIVGETLKMAQRYGVEGIGGIDLTGSVAFGVVFGPHISFGGGAAAVAYAAKKGYIDTGFDYHEAKNITRGLGVRPDVLAVGGVFGVFGYIVGAGSVALSAPWDPVAFGVVVSAFAHRTALGYDIVGYSRGGLKEMFDMSASEFLSREDDEASAEEIADGGRVSRVEPWLPHQCRMSGVVFLGVVVGVLGSYLAYVTGSAFLGFGVSAASLVFINAGVDEIPVTHHITLPASTGALAYAGKGFENGISPVLAETSVPLGEILVVGALFGGVGAVAGEVTQRLFYAHADTHLDPPAASIVFTSLVIASLAMLGVFESSVWVPHP